MSDWKKIVLKLNDTLQKAIELLDSEALGIIMVADEQGKLLGTVTDGDIRRALIKNHDMNTPLADVMFKTPTVASVSADREAIFTMMRSKGILQVPIVGMDREIVGLETLQNYLEVKKIDNPVFLLAGGFGKRLQPLTDDTPKPLLIVGNKPILEIIINQFIEAGFHNFYISTHYKAELIREHFGDGSQWGVNINYVHEEKPLGTAGALGLLPKNLPELPILVMNGDLLTKVNFERLLNYHIEQAGVATMCVCKYDFQVPFGVIKSKDSQIVSIVEKPVHNFFVNAGIYVLNNSLLKSTDGQSYIDMPHLLETHINNEEPVNMFPIHEYWLDIGGMEQYEKAQLDSENL